MPGLSIPSGISDVVMCFKQEEGGEAAGCWLLVEVEKEGEEIVLLCVWGTDCFGLLLRLTRFLGLVANAWTLFMSSGLQC